jgi:hypothetical protein
MIELENTSDPVRLSFLRSALEAAGIDSFLFDAGAPWPGAIPIRLMVDEDDAPRARRVIAQAERDISPL